MVMLTYGTDRKLKYEKELGELVAFFKKNGFHGDRFANSEIQGPYRKFGTTLGAYFWQGYEDVKSPFHKSKLR